MIKQVKFLDSLAYLYIFIYGTSQGTMRDIAIKHSSCMGNRVLY